MIDFYFWVIFLIYLFVFQTVVWVGVEIYRIIKERKENEIYHK